MYINQHFSVLVKIAEGYFEECDMKDIGKMET